MCGICGLILTRPRALEVGSVEGIVRRMASALSHRGPDEEGFRLLGGGDISAHRPLVALGHRRLSIIDLEGGHQPISNEDGSVWTVYNGEVYNFPLLREELAGRGHVLRTRCDTECLVHLYEELRADLVERLMGMFAFAVWDERRMVLTLARDRLGQKPLYYVHDEARGLFAFASELKALLEIPGLDRTIAPDAVCLYLTLLYVPHPLAILRSVRKLPPAHTLTFDCAAGRVDVRRYWRPRFTPDPAPDAAALKRDVLETLSDATRLRLISDVPLGAFLSGGVDSSIVVSLMSRLSSSPVRTFSIGFDSPEYDETHYARLVARHCRTEHTEEVVRPKALEVLPKLAWHYDEPFGDSSAVPTYCVSQAARRHVKVVLTGDGGDECFGGYPRYFASWREDVPMRRALRLIGSLPIWEMLPGGPASRFPTARLKRFARSLRQSPEEAYLSRIGVFSEVFKDAVLAEDFREATRHCEPLEFLRQYYREAPHGGFVHRTMYVDLMTYLPCDLLVKVDIASMAHGLEARSPFLDHRVAELAGRIPVEMKLRAGPQGVEGKCILKEAFAELLPGPVLTRGKMGFGVPIVQWFRGELKGMLHDVLLSRRALERGYFRGAALRDMIERHTSGRADFGTHLWVLLMLELWHERFADGNLGARP
jgi:asparagine synthase (glutamine-hydrolysing)